MPDNVPTPKYRIDEEAAHSNVYPPAEDTFLLLDALEKEREFIASIGASLSLEIGCGSGVVTVFLRQLLFKHSKSEKSQREDGFLAICTDLNRQALKCTLETANLNSLDISSQWLEFIQCDAMFPLLPRLENAVDVLLLNPPYVPTEEAPKDEKELCYAGGKDGRLLLDRILPSVSTLLSPNGVFYLVALRRENNVDDLTSADFKDKFGIDGSVVLERQCRNERLCVLKFTRVNSSSSREEKRRLPKPGEKTTTTTTTPKTPVATPTSSGGSSSKITLLLKPVGAAPQLRKEFTKYKVDPGWTIFNLQQTLRKLLGLKKESSPLFLFVKEAFAPSPEHTVGNLHQCFGSGGILYVHYGLTPAWG